jgi:hypothetical protein
MMHTLNILLEFRMICDMLGRKKILKILVKAISKEAIIKRRN